MEEFATPSMQETRPELSKKGKEPKTPKAKGGGVGLFLGKWLSVAVFLMIAAQCVYLLVKGVPYCPTDGCRLVDEASPLSPMNTNAAGLVYFGVLIALFHCAQRRPDGGGLARFLLGPVLVAGMAAEGVMATFQYRTEAFCPYCLMILGGLFLINLFHGGKQTFAAIFSFIAVALASFLLMWPQGKTPGNLAQKNISLGSVAVKAGPAGSDERILFFKESCTHCKAILAELLEDNSATLRLNPLAALQKLELPGATLQQVFEPDANRAFLRALNIDTVPVLMVRKPDGGLTMYQGVNQIATYLQDNFKDSTPTEPVETPALPTTSTTPATTEAAVPASPATPAEPAAQPQKPEAQTQSVLPGQSPLTEQPDFMQQDKGSCSIDDKDCKN